MAELAKGDQCPECGNPIENLVPYESSDITHPRRARASQVRVAIEPCDHKVTVQAPYHGPTII
ncbi:hypothetical protein DER29_4326 [Micromonospora sp. M71_S20]|uniref:hypothetical protein n=1 Tax=Micromonospora sp. M71_S20 TaxID=592872 RepID=UPI000EB01E54|nr:hypothetical protein [Micromonospora sp. M71_S20]RLK13309.1 hypothetical protein DER29_4326 [Micromonospora sp. M71_S20]